LGALVASAVGPGPTEKSERFYLSYLYYDNALDIVAADPATGATQVFANPVPTECGARAMAVGLDGCIYFGTLPNAHFLQLDPRAGNLIDLGRPSVTEEYIWEVAFGPDRKLYGVTYPQARLVRYDPAARRLEDLGRLDPVEMYARFIGIDDDGFVYAGIGMSKANIAAYEIATGEHREILPPEFQQVGVATVYRGRDGHAYGALGGTYFRLRGWSATPIKPDQTAPREEKDALAAGQTISIDGWNMAVTNRVTHQSTERRLDYAGNLLNVFRLGLGPDGKLYGSSVLPLDLVRFDGNGQITNLGEFGGGESYSFLSHQNRLLTAAYSALAPLMSFDPATPVRLEGPGRNPALTSFKGCDGGWRPEAMIEGPDGKVYVGAVSGYGKLGGPLAAWDVAAGTVEQFPNVVTGQSVVTLAVWKNLLVGGTTIEGGGGSHPTGTEARLFLWDPVKREKIFETIPIAGAGSLDDLITAANGMVYGFGNGMLFAFDPAARAVVARVQAPFSATIYNSVAIGPDGKIWGLAPEGIFTIDTKTNGISITARAPKTITGGFAMRGRTVYFASGAESWQWTSP
jgi:hypothetical protein